MGTLDAADWAKAAWIGFDQSRQIDLPRSPRENAGKPKPAKLILPPPTYLRTTFRVDRPVRRAILYTTALGIFDAHLNGRGSATTISTPAGPITRSGSITGRIDVTRSGPHRRKRPGRNSGRRLV